MENKYLNKIAGVISSVVQPLLGIGKGIAKDVGQSAKTALGGGYREAAIAKGITNQHTLRGIKTPGSFLNATHPVGPPTAETSNQIKSLQKDKSKAIMKSVGYGGAAIYGSNKILNKIKERNEQPQYYQ